MNSATPTDLVASRTNTITQEGGTRDVQKTTIRDVYIDYGDDDDTRGGRDHHLEMPEHVWGGAA